MFEKIELWHLKISLIEFQGHTLVRATHIRGDKLWNGKPYKDFDPKGSLNSDAVFATALSFTREFGLNFPMPIGPKTWGKIIACADFPNFEEWEKLYGSYSRELYQSDLLQFWTHRRNVVVRTHETLFLKLRRNATRLLAGVGPLGGSITPQDQATYARMALYCFRDDRERLDNFWGTQLLTPECEKAVQVLNGLVSGYAPEVKQNKKKELAATREIAPKAKKTRKSKQVEGQGTLW